MANADNTGEIDPNEIDLSAVMEYMQRNNLTRMKLLIEAVEEHESAPAPGAVMVAERRDLIDDTMPSDLGLEGVFLVALI
jgi:hypothetical protein